MREFPVGWGVVSMVMRKKCSLEVSKRGKCTSLHSLPHYSEPSEYLQCPQGEKFETYMGKGVDGISLNH